MSVVIRTLQEKQEFVKQFKASGKSMSSWCWEQGIPTSTFSKYPWQISGRNQMFLPGNGSEGVGNKIFRQATEMDAQSMQNLYEKYNASQGRNVASIKGTINGKSVNLESVSGKINPSNPTYKGNITTPTENHYILSNGRLYDSEQKMIESLREMYKDNPKITGEIKIVSQRAVCDGGQSVIDRFQKEFPNIKVIIVEVLTE